MQTTQSRREQNVLRRARRVPIPVKFLAIANERGQRKTQLKRYKNILLTGNRYKIS